MLTDFGTADGYVGAVKGVLAELCPEARLVDITHDIAPGDVRAGAFALMTSARMFPAGSIHLAVVDPGVGTERRGLLIESCGSFFVGPDNGLLSLAVEGPKRIYALDKPRWFRPPVSATFHGRDVFAPIAARVASGDAPDELGTPVLTMLEIVIPPARREGVVLRGEVFHVDRFGNLVTSLRERDLPLARERLRLNIAGLSLSFRETYGHAAPGTLIALVGSSGFVEIASVEGSAARVLGPAAAGIGAPLEVQSG